MSGYTKGPWFANNTSRRIGPISKEGNQSQGMVTPVAWVEFDPEVEVQVANANLIAAAPELLEALQSIVTTDADVMRILSEDQRANAEAAIKKALGQ